MHGKQSTSWVASYDKNYVVLMMVTQAGTGSGTSGPAVRKIWEALYGVKGMKVNTAKAALPGARPPAGLPVFAQDGEILPPMAPRREGQRRGTSDERRRGPPTGPAPAAAGSTGTTTRVKAARLDWVLMLAAGGAARGRRAAGLVGDLGRAATSPAATRTPTSRSSWSTSRSASCSA